MSQQNQHLEALQDIRQMMQRSSRFISLSGLSGVAAGVCGLVGSYAAHRVIQNYSSSSVSTNDINEYAGADPVTELRTRLFLLAVGVLALAVLSAFFFTWRKTKKDGVQLWNHTSIQLSINMALPLAAGGLFIISLLQYGIWIFVAPGCLVFYGLALINASKYTLSDIRYLGISEVVLGLISTQFPGSGLLFWAIGFGVLHIIYGTIMWLKYERKTTA